MAYAESMNSANPGCIIIMIDQSASMSDSYGDNGEEKKDLTAKAVNRVIYEIIEASADGEEIKDRAFIGVIGYGTKNPGVELLLGDMISNIANNPKRVEKITKKISDGAGGLVEVEEDFPIWVEALADWGTPMDAAFQRTAQLADEWCKTHPDSFPPVVINITDGEPYDMDNTRVEAEKLLKISNNDGDVLLFNAHLADGRKPSLVLPNDKSGLNNNLAEFLYDISSDLPDALMSEAKDIWETVDTGAKGMIYNAGAEDLIRMLNFGSTKATVR